MLLPYSGSARDNRGSKISTMFSSFSTFSSLFAHHVAESYATGCRSEQNNKMAKMGYELDLHRHFFVHFKNMTRLSQILPMIFSSYPNWRRVGPKSLTMLNPFPSSREILERLLVLVMLCPWLELHSPLRNSLHLVSGCGICFRVVVRWLRIWDFR